ncbi:MAG: hypothetical protein K9M54_11835 [Kiritimatiellales bacterium]|nr:hypothetical protein [Kiritimatiellales bacterium]MCF7863542.1 hypothetical protein [Kiritimatiellales bacterium]
MMGENKNQETTAENPADVLLQQLLHLKRYEIPDTHRMVKNKQNIMRLVRESSSRKRWSLSDLIEVNIPWFFAEPRYGIAALFIVFAGLQFVGVNSQRQAAHNKMGIYTSDQGLASLDASMAASTNRFTYPKIPNNLQLFASPSGGDGTIRPVGLREQSQ